MANFESSFYQTHAVQVDDKKLSEKFVVEHTQEGVSPDGYSYPESMIVREKGKHLQKFEIHRDGSAQYYTDEGALNPDFKESYTMMGVDTDSKEFKQFVETIQKPENFNAQTVEKMLDTVPQLTAEKQVETLNQIDAAAKAEYEAAEKQKAENFIGSEYAERLADKGFTKERLAEMNAEIASANFMADDKEIERQLVDEINQELTANGHDEILLKGSMAEAYRESSANNPEISNKTLNEIQKQAELKGVDDNFAYDTDKAEKYFAEAIKQIDTGIEKSTEKVNSKINELQSSLGVDYATAEKIENIRDQQNVKGGAEIAQPGRTYTGNVVSVDEDKTIQVTKTGKLVIHETENLPGIKEQDTGGHLQIRYSAEGKGDITAKSNDMEIGKQKEVEKHHQVGGMER